MINLSRIIRSTSLLLAIISGGVTTAAAQPICSAPLFGTGFDGEPTHGSKDALITAVNRGEPVRVGWALDFDDDGEGELVHWADAAFLSVWEGEVFTQVDAIHTQSPLRNSGDVQLRAPFVEWRGSLGTNGMIEGRYSDGTTVERRKAQIYWCSGLPGSDRSWTLLYRNGTDGEDLAGSKDALFAAIRSGHPIQIGWGFSRERDGETLSIEHLVSPVFVSITNGTHVTAQLPEHIAQRSYADADEAFFDDPSVLWRGLMSTTGSFDAVWVDRASGDEVRRHPQRAMLSWYAPVSPRLATPALAVPKGVINDAGREDERRPVQ